MHTHSLESKLVSACKFMAVKNFYTAAERVLFIACIRIAECMIEPNLPSFLVMFSAIEIYSIKVHVI